MRKEGLHHFPADGELHVWRAVKYGPALIDTFKTHSSHSDEDQLKSGIWNMSETINGNQQGGFMLVSE